VVSPGEIRWLPVRPTVPISGYIETFEAPDTLHVRTEFSPCLIASGTALKESMDGRFS
jgi:hypothetical protein